MVGITSDTIFVIEVFEGLHVTFATKEFTFIQGECESLWGDLAAMDQNIVTPVPALDKFLFLGMKIESKNLSPIVAPIAGFNPAIAQGAARYHLEGQGALTGPVESHFD